MAELTTSETAAASCCSPAAQETAVPADAD